MGNHRATVVRFRLLRQTTYSLSYGKAIFSEDGPQESCLSRKFVDSKVGPLASPTFGVQIPRPTHSGRAKWWQMDSLES